MRTTGWRIFQPAPPAPSFYPIIAMRQQYHSRPSPRGRLIWDVTRLMRLAETFPVREVRLADIRELDEPFWYGGEDDVPTCRSIADHARLIRETDLRYPILLSSDGRLMDGMHRVCKAYLEGRESISAVQFETDPEPDYIDVDLNSLPYS